MKKRRKFLGAPPDRQATGNTRILLDAVEAGCKTVIASNQPAQLSRVRPGASRTAVSAMSSPGTQLAAQSIQERSLEVVRQLLVELGSASAIEALDHRRTAAHLERDLALGSLERVELMLRLGSEFGVRLPDQVVAEADTVGDLVAAILRLETGGPENGDASSAASATAPWSTPAPSPDLLHELAEAKSLTEVLRLRALAEPERAHVCLLHEDGTARPITYGELYERSGAVATALVGLGINPGDTVALMLPTCADFFFCFFGVQLAGAIPVPIYPPFRADRIEEYAARQAGILQNAEARLLVTFREAESVARLLQPRVPSLRDVVDAARLTESSSAAVLAGVPGVAGRPIAPHHRGRGEDIAFLQYTSGSTGDPKGVVLTHANLLANIRAIGEGIDFQPDDAAVSWLPLYHDMGLIGAWFVPLYFAIPVVILSPLAFLARPERWLWAVHHHRATITPAPNFAFELCIRKIADRDIEGLDLSRVRAALNGAEPVNPATLDRFVERFARYGFRREALMPVYGLAEASLCVSCPPMGAGAKVDRIQRDPFEREGRAIPAAANDSRALEFVFAGRPLSNMEVRIVDSQGHDVGERQQGQLCFRSPSATSGYYRNPEATRAILRGGGWIDSGDLAYRADGDLYITGRSKDVIIKGGRNIYPHEVEDIVGRVPGVRTGCVVAFGVSDERSGTERLIVAAELRDFSARDRIAGDVTRQLTESLGLPPDTVVPLAPHCIPKTSSGKLRRSETKRLYLEGRLGSRLLPTWLQVTKLAASNAGPWLLGAVRRAMRRTMEIAYGVYALVGFGVLLLPMWLAVLLSPSRRAAARISSSMTRLILAVVGVPVRIEGGELRAEFDKSSPWIFVPNHTSYVDILALIAYLPPGARFVAKSEVASWPFIGTILRRVGHFAFDRSDPQARLAQSGAVEEALQRGESVIIFPEGTFIAAPGIRPFQLGAFKAAVETRRPICPVAVRGAREVLRDGTYLPRPGRVTLTFGPLLTPQAESGWQEMVRLRDATREILARNAAEPLL